MSDTFEGIVCWFNAEFGYGFVSWEKDGVKQPDMFAHFSDICAEGFRQLKAGQKVRFTIGKNNEGRPKATDIEVIE